MPAKGGVLNLRDLPESSYRSLLSSGSYMNTVLAVTLNTNPTQAARLKALQRAFAQVCNALAPVAQQSRCWNRVALHHMTYKTLRQRFPELGSQMVCNAIYSVCRAARSIYQHPASPFNLQRLGDKPLPLLKFLPQAPVYFDRHTLSLKDGQVSLFTLDGRMRFQVALGADQEQRFRTAKLREVVLNSEGERFTLSFSFADADDGDDEPTARSDAGELPEYLVVVEGRDAGEPKPAGPAALPPAAPAPGAPTHPTP